MAKNASAARPAGSPAHNAAAASIARLSASVLGLGEGRGGREGGSLAAAGVSLFLVISHRLSGAADLVKRVGLSDAAASQQGSPSVRPSVTEVKEPIERRAKNRYRPRRIRSLSEEEGG